ncbi:prepilin peptidase [Crossiella sp. CA198]|uniref:prepilin peptidase n=1 Tax=Crossiella sp. CA198 TaxID=3455607 RepID=UPI003F8D5F71
MDSALVAGWTALGGAAGVALAWRLPVQVRAMVGICAALAWLALAGRFGGRPVLLAFGWFAVVGVVLAATDLVERRLPNRLTLPSYPALLALFTLAAAAEKDHRALVRAVLVTAVALVVHLVIYLGAPGQLGAGDVKASGLCGLVVGWLGWSAAGSALLLCYLTAAITLAVARVAARLRRRGRVGEVPLGPFLIGASLLVLLLGHTWPPTL